MDDAKAATTVTRIAVTGFALRRTSRNNAANVVLSSRMLSSTTPRSPHIPFRPAKITSASHSHANHTSPGLEKENTSCVGTRWFEMIHSPVRMCHPVSQSPSSVFTPSRRPNRSAMGVRNAKSASDGSHLIANWEPLFSIAESRHPGTRCRRKRLNRPKAVVKRTEVHVVHAQRHLLAFRRPRHPRHGSLTVNTFLPESVICRQLDLYRHNLAQARHRRPFTIPGNQDPAAADVLRGHRRFRP